MMSTIFKLFAIRDPSLYLQFYASYILPIIDYCSSIYVNASIRNVNEIEKILRFFTRRLFRRFRPSAAVPKFSSRLKEFGLCSYEERSLRNDLLLLHRIFKFSSIVPGVELSESSFRPNRLVVSPPCCSPQRLFCS